MNRLRWKLAWVWMGVAACGGDESSADGEDTTEATETSTDATEEETGAETGDTGDTATTDDTAASDDTDSTDETGGPLPLEDITLPQAVAGAMWANPTVYPSIPVHVATVGDATEVTITVEGRAPVDAEEASPGDWVASVPLDGLGASAVMVVADATDGAIDLQVEAELVLGDSGIQFTNFDADGPGLTPRLHRREDGAVLTWADRSDAGTPRGWMVDVDGAGRRLGDPIATTPAGDEALYARTTAGETNLAVLYQMPNGSPYLNRFRIIDAEGGEVLAPVSVDMAPQEGSFGGDVTFDGTGFVAAWRSNAGADDSDVYWMRVDEDGTNQIGPISVGTVGNDDPYGGFDPFTFVTVAALPDLSVVVWTQDRWSMLLGLEVPKSRIVAMDGAGNELLTGHLGPETDLHWSHQAHAYTMGDEIIALWHTDDLNDPSNPIPTAVRAWGFDASTVGDDEGAGTISFQDADHRTEAALVDTTSHRAVMAWLDERSYTLEGLANGQIELTAAGLGDDLVAAPEVVFEHARFVAGTSELGGAPAGSNAIFVWVDQRSGGGIANPQAEVYLETVWH